MADITTLTPRPNRALRALSFWHEVTVRGLRDLPYDLSSRQLGILLSVYLEPPPHTIRSLSASLSVSKPAVCRAVDALEQLKLVKRLRDKEDKRNVLVQRTVKGSVHLSEFADIIMAVSKAVA